MLAAELADVEGAAVDDWVIGAGVVVDASENIWIDDLNAARWILISSVSLQKNAQYIHINYLNNKKK